MPKNEAARVGLCERCRHVRVVATERSRYWMCTLAARDPRFDKYPRLPVLECVGYEEGAPTESGPSKR